jgi:ferredoxin
VPNILTLITGNLLAGPQTLRFPQRVAPAPAFRGAVELDAGRCITCGVCAEVCVSAAIEVRPGVGDGSWTYDPAACTFCGACVSHCPVEALRQAADRGDPYGRPGDQRTVVVVPYPACERCGCPTLPSAVRVSDSALPQASKDLRARAGLCPACRRRTTAEAMMNSLSELKPEGRDGR